MTTKNWQDDVRDSAHKIWLAGLGALSLAEEGGSKLFRELVEQGERFEADGKAQVKDVFRGAENVAAEGAAQARKVAESARRVAEGLWGKGGENLDDTVARALHKVGVPTREEIAALSRRVEELTHAVERLRGSEGLSTAGPSPVPNIATPADVVTTTADVATDSE